MFQNIVSWIKTPRAKRIIKDVGISLSIAFSTYKAYTSNNLFLEEKARKEAVEKVKTEHIEHLQKDKDSLICVANTLTYSFNNVLINTIEHSYNLEDIRLPLLRKVYDVKTDAFYYDYANQTYMDAYLKGKRRSFVVGKTDVEIYGENIGKEYIKTARQALESDEPVNNAVFYPKKNGGVGVANVTEWKVKKDEVIYIYILINKNLR